MNFHLFFGSLILTIALLTYFWPSFKKSRNRYVLFLSQDAIGRFFMGVTLLTVIATATFIVGLYL
jgi:hypothetical protein